MVYTPNDTDQFLYIYFILFFDSNLWKPSKAKYSFKPIGKQRDCKCVNTGHENISWLKMFCGDMMLHKQHALCQILHAYVLHHRAGHVAPLAFSSSIWRAWYRTAHCVAHLWSLMEWHSGWILSLCRRLTHVDTRNTDLLGKQNNTKQHKTGI